MRMKSPMWKQYELLGGINTLLSRRERCDTDSFVKVNICLHCVCLQMQAEITVSAPRSVLSKEMGN
jgi:hypothetical protein